MQHKTVHLPALNLKTRNHKQPKKSQCNAILFYRKFDKTGAFIEDSIPELPSNFLIFSFPLDQCFWIITNNNANSIFSVMYLFTVIYSQQLNQFQLFCNTFWIIKSWHCGLFNLENWIKFIDWKFLFAVPVYLPVLDRSESIQIFIPTLYVPKKVPRLCVLCYVDVVVPLFFMS